METHSIKWYKLVASALWNVLAGEVSHASLNTFITYTLKKYPSHESIHKTLMASRNFLNYLGDIRFDPIFSQYARVLKTPRNAGYRRCLPPVIVDEDIRSVIRRIETCEAGIPRRAHHLTLLLTAVYTGQRPETIARLTRNNLTAACDTGILKIPASIDKTRRDHFVPIPPHFIPIIQTWLNSLNGENQVFILERFQRWLQKQRIALTHTPLNGSPRFFKVGDCRKYFQQKCDELGIPRPVVNFCMSHELSGVVARHYSNFREETIRSEMKKWDSVRFELKNFRAL
jgi:intergrase/recombinase